MTQGIKEILGSSLGMTQGTKEILGAGLKPRPRMTVKLRLKMAEESLREEK